MLKWEIMHKSVVGKTREISRISKYISERKNLFVWGNQGTGKTFIVKYVLDTLGDKRVLYSHNSVTLKSSLLGFLSNDFDARYLLRRNILSLRKLFYEKAKRDHPYFVFDHIERVNSRLYSFIDNLIDDYNVLIIARCPDSACIGRLVLLLCFFDKLEVSNLEKRHAYELIDYFIDVFNLNISDMNYFRREVFGISRGNPSIIKDICRYAKDDKYMIGKKINLNILNLDRKILDLKL